MEPQAPVSAPQSSVNTILIGITVILILICAVGGVLFFMKKRSQPQETPVRASHDEQTPPTTAPQTTSETGTMWQLGAEGWQKMMGTPPTCPEPMVFQPPVNVQLATGILYPGQTRGGNYKPHGGFRFDTISDNKVSVTAPLDAYVVRGSRYLSEGQTQYTFDFIVPCGYMYRLGHLLVLTPEFQKIAETFPPAQEGDSRTTNVNPPVIVKTGQEIATQVGVKNNTFLDWGVYDLKNKNAAAQNPEYAKSHGVELDQHAVCWFDLVPNKDKQRINNLPPGDPTSGKTSDYCK